MKSFAASCTADNAAVALEENRPHIERILLLEKMSVTCGTVDCRDDDACAAGEGERDGIGTRRLRALRATGSCPRTLSCLVLGASSDRPSASTDDVCAAGESPFSVVHRANDCGADRLGDGLIAGDRLIAGDGGSGIAEGAILTGSSPAPSTGATNSGS